jgi:hypothetical protein
LRKGTIWKERGRELRGIYREREGQTDRRTEREREREDIKKRKPLERDRKRCERKRERERGYSEEETFGKREEEKLEG